MISKTNDQRKLKNGNNKEGRKSYRRLMNELQRATDNAKNVYLECICDKTMEFQRRECYDLMYMKTMEISWKENQRIQNTGIKDSQGNVTADQRQVLKIWKNYITELYD
jgi:hypothetical protein